MGDILSSREAAEQLGVHLSTIRRWAAKGKLTPLNKAGQYKFTREEIKRILEERQRGTRQAAE